MAETRKRVSEAPRRSREEGPGEKGRKLMARLDQAILQEIVRFVQSRSRVPQRVQVHKRQYELTYLDDHQQRLEETLHRRDVDRLNMLFGQLASKVKYKLVRPSTARGGASGTAKKRPKTAKKTRKAAKKSPTRRSRS